MAELPPVPAWRLELRDSAAIDPTAKLVGLVLSTFMDGAGRAALSRSRIADGCGLSVRVVRRAIGRLEAAGVLGVDRVKGGARACNRYQARTANGDVRVPVRPPPTGTPATPLGSPNGVADDPLTGTPATPELEGQKVKNRGRAPAPAHENGAAPEGWRPEDDAAIAAEFRAREAARAAAATGSTEGYGDPANAQAARAAAVHARAVLGAQTGTDRRP